MTNAARFEALRDFFTQVDADDDHDDQNDWDQLCALFDDWPEGEDIEVALDYAVEHTNGWAWWIRHAPYAWVNRFVNTGQAPRLRLGASLEWDSHGEGLYQLIGSPLASNLVSLQVDYPELEPPFFRAVADSPHLGALRRLTATEALCDDADFAHLAASERRFEAFVLYRCFTLTDAVFSHLETSPVFEGLSEFGAGDAVFSDARVITFLQTERGRQLNTLILGDFLTDGTLPQWIQTHADELALVDLDLGQMWEVDYELKEDLAMRYNMILE